MANSYTSRLKKRLPAPADINWDDEWHDNERLDEVVAGALLSVNRIVSGGAVTDGGGLTASYAAAVVSLAGVLLNVSAGSVLLTAAQAGKQLVNWIYVNSSGVVVAGTTPPSGDYIPLAMVDTSDTAIVRIADLRPIADNWFFMNALGTIRSLFANANTAARTYTFKDRDGTIADDTDLALKAPLASPALTGAPTAPTPANSDNSTKIATTAFLRNVFASGAGYQKLPDGKIKQFGAVNLGATPGAANAVTFPIAFASGVASLQVTPISDTTTVANAWVSGITTTGMNVRGGAYLWVYWEAIGS